MEVKKNSKNINEIKSWFFHKAMIDKPLGRMTKKKMEKI